MALCRTSEGLEKLLAAKAPTSDLQETHLDKAAPWLGSLSSSSTQMLLGHLLDAKRTHAMAYAKLGGINMPAISDEGMYRKSGVRHVGTLADLSRVVEEAIKRMKDLRSALSKLKSCKFGSEGDSPGLTNITKFQENNGWYPLDPVPGEADSLLACKEANFHVAAVAAMCLLRSESIQGGTPDPKACKQLTDITMTLKLKFNLLPERNGDLRKHGAALLAECERASAGKKRKSDAAEDPTMNSSAKAPAKAEKAETTTALAVAESVATAKSAESPACQGEQAACDNAAALGKEADAGDVDDRPEKEEKVKDKEKTEKKKDKKEKQKDKQDKRKDKKENKNKEDAKDKKEKKEKKEKKQKDKKEKPDEDKSKEKAKKKEKKERSDEKTDGQMLSTALRKQLWSSPKKRKSKEIVDEEAVDPEPKATPQPKGKGKAKAKAAAGQSKGKGRGRGRK